MTHAEIKALADSCLARAEATMVCPAAMEQSARDVPALAFAIGELLVENEKMRARLEAIRRANGLADTRTTAR